MQLVKIISISSMIKINISSPQGSSKLSAYPTDSSETLILEPTVLSFQAIMSKLVAINFGSRDARILLLHSNEMVMILISRNMIGMKKEIRKTATKTIRKTITKRMADKGAQLIRNKSSVMLSRT